MMMHTYTPNQCPYQMSTFSTLQNQRKWIEQDFQTQGHYDKVKSRLHDVAHL